MRAWFASGPFKQTFLRGRRDDGTTDSQPQDLTWQALPRAAQLYVASVIVAGATILAAFLPSTYPRPVLFAVLLVLAFLTSAWKVNLPLPLASGATLSVSEAANFMTLLLFGPGHAVVVAVAGVWTQCTVNVRRLYPHYRTLFSVAAEALTMAATGLTYRGVGGSLSAADFSMWALTLGAAIVTCFFVNTALIAAAVALSTGRNAWKVWRDEFLWSGVSFLITGSAGAAAALVIDRGDYLTAVLMLVPAYATYQTYRFFVTRLEKERTISFSLAEEKAGLAAALADTTLLEKMHTELLHRERVARSSAEQANVLKDQFLATVSHELRTPLTSILGWADMLRSGVLDVASRDRAGRAIYIGAQRQAQLIDELLDVARIMADKLRLEFTMVDLRDVVRNAVDIVQPNADAKRIVIGVEEDPSIGVVYGDSGRLQQVATNLLANAVKFTPEGGEVDVRLRRADDLVEMIVSDNGHGIPADFLPSVFEPFLQADATSIRVHGGLGLGLSIVKNLVDAHGGTICAASGGEGQGATFTVRLPLAAASENQPEAIASDLLSADELAVETDLLEGITVLVVDDDDESRLVVGAYLEVHGARVLTASSAVSAMELLQRNQVDVLLADVAMPGEDGYTFIRRIRAFAATSIASIPAAALTAFARNEDRENALQAGFQLHLAKPIAACSLVAAVARLAKGDRD
jgi:signal transduction histidine kinase/CheY-like chemotaxis protein